MIQNIFRCYFTVSQMHCFGKNLCKVSSGGGLVWGGGGGLGGGRAAILLNHTTTTINDYLTRRPRYTSNLPWGPQTYNYTYIHTRFTSIVLNKQDIMNIAVHTWKHYTRYVGCTQL